MNKNTILKGSTLENTQIKTRVINTGDKNNAKLQMYKKAVIDKATQEINKIEEDIKIFE